MKGLFLIFVILGLALQASASSHSEAPGTAKKPSSDIADFYMWRSTSNPDNLILALGVAGLQNPNAGPNWYTFSDQHFFEFHLVCDAASVESAHVFQFYFGSRFNGQGTAIYQDDYDYSQCEYGQPTSTQRSVALDIGTSPDVHTVDIPLKVFSKIYDPSSTATADHINVDAINFIESYHLNYYTNIGVDQDFSDATPTVVTQGGSSTFRVPFTYVGDKTFGSPSNYETYASKFIYNTNNFLTCGSTPVGARVFAGPRQEPFFIDLGRTFDLINFSPPIIGNSDSTIRNCASNNDIIQHNTNYIVLEIPICAIQCPNVAPNVLGAWTAVRELLHDAEGNHIPGRLTNRFGNPLINELIIGIGDKQAWNYDHPFYESDFAEYYRYPVVPQLINILFGVTPPTVPVGGRSDLIELLARGIPGLNRVGTQNNVSVVVTYSDLLRINLDSLTDLDNYNVLGVIEGDTAGYPNGRRPYDDVVDITLRAAMGVLCDDKYQGGFGCSSDDAPAANVPFGDGVSSSADDYPSAFPFFNTPNVGATTNDHPRHCSSASAPTVALFSLFAILAFFLTF